MRCFSGLNGKMPRDVSDECRATAERKGRNLIYKDLSVLILELAPEKESDQPLNAYAPEVATLGTMAVGIKDLDMEKGLPLRMVAI